MPGRDTSSRLFDLLDPDRFEAAFGCFMASFSEACRGVVAVDGKVRRSFDRASGRSARHVVST